MPNSYAQSTTVPCVRCHQPIQTEVWVIVDANERPDLLTLLHNGALHPITCPHCDYEQMVESAVLIFQPGQTPKLVFRPNRNASAAQNETAAQQLLEILRERLGTYWQDSWVNEAEGLTQNLEHKGSLASHKSLLPIIEQFVRAPSWQESQRVVEANPELLSDDTIAFIERLIKIQDDRQAINLLKEHRTLLLRCRTLGIAAAFAEKDDGPAIPPSFMSDIQIARNGQQRFLHNNEYTALEDALHAWQRILNHTDFSEAPDPFRLMALNDAGAAFLHRYWSYSQSSDLDMALSLWKRVVAQTPPGAPSLPAHLSNLGVGLSARYDRTGVVADLQEAVRAYEQAARLTPTSVPDYAARLNNLANGQRQLYLRTGNLEMLDTMIQTYEKAILSTPPDTFEHSLRLSNLAVALRDRYARTRVREDLDRAILLHKQAVETTPLEAHSMPSLLNNLGAALRTRYERSGQLPDVEEAISVYERAITLIPQNSPELASYLNNLGIGLYTRYEQTGKEVDLAAAIHSFEQAVAQTPATAPDLTIHLNSLGAGIYASYLRTGRLEALERAVSIYEKVVEQTPADSPKLPSHLDNLGVTLHARYERTGSVGDLETAITVFEQALALVDDNVPDLLSLLNNFGIALRARYEHNGHLADLEAAIQTFERALALTPTDAPNRPFLLTNVGAGLRTRYAQRGHLEDLETSLRFSQQAVDQAHRNAPNFAIYLSNLGNTLRACYAQSGSLQDLDAAIQAFEQSVTATPIGAKDMALRLSNLGTGLSDRYRRTGRQADLDAAIDAYAQAVAYTPDHSSDIIRYLNNLGAGLSARYKRTKVLADLETAIQTFERAATLGVPNTPDFASLLNNWAAGLRIHFLHSGKLDDLEKAIKLYQQIVDQTPTNASGLVIYLNNLGNALRDRYAYTRQLEDLEQAITVYQQAVEQTPNDSPNRASFLINLGLGLQARYEQIKSLNDLSAAIDAFNQACQLGSAVALDEALSSAHNWASWAFRRQEWSELLSATQFGRQALDRLFAVQIGRQSQESILMQGRGLTMLEAYAQARLGNWESAVEAIEQGRARLLAEALEQSRSDLLRLPTLGYDHLYKRYQHALNHRASLLLPIDEELQGGALSIAAMNNIDRLAALDENFSDLQTTIAEIQKLPGFEDFFVKPSITRIHSAFTPSTNGESIGVYLLSTEQCGLALILHNERIIPIWLDELNEAVVLTMLRAWFDAYEDSLRNVDARKLWFDQIDQITHELWNRAVGPIVNALTQITQETCTTILPVVTLIPTGLLALLPLHAAWTEDTSMACGRRYLVDDYAVRYAPSATALRHCRERVGTVKVEQLLALDEPKPIRGASSLPNSSREVKAIASLFPVPTVLQHEQASREATLDTLAAAQVAHFSCHGMNNWQNPLDSGLLLANDELLTVRDLLELRLPGARLATLSACETGIVGTDLPDEVIMLPSALVQAGYAGVVASLWSVADMSTAVLMVRFYQYWREGRLEPIYALRAAQQWVRDTTNKQKADYFAQFIPPPTDSKTEAVRFRDLEDLGRSAPTLASRMIEPAAEFFSSMMLSPDGPDARAFAHPFWWAAFYLTGV